MNAVLTSLHSTLRTFTFIGFHPSRDEMRSSPVSMRSYSFVIFGFCLLFLIFGYRSLRSGASQEEEEDYFAEGEGEGDAGTESLAKLLQAKCRDKKLERIGEHSICQAKNLNKERNCLIFSVATSSDLKFESRLAGQLDKCKVRVYDHEAKASDSDGKYKVVEKLDADRLAEKQLAKILGAEKRGKVHLLRLEAGADTAKLAQNKLLKERSICHLLLTVSGMTETELGFFVRKMRQTYGYSLYAANVLGKAAGGGATEAEDAGEAEEPEEETEVEAAEGKKTVGDGKASEKEGAIGKPRAANSFTLSLIADGCKKGYEIRDS